VYVPTPGAVVVGVGDVVVPGCVIGPVVVGVKSGDGGVYCPIPGAVVVGLTDPPVSGIEGTNGR
jgi:hypothetical protein